ncbi:hypothetical protein MKZ38_004795 [Zalerion maritima]|uniref:Uncharacterized protein n=1 Tax=Zalerion maritima TaxID=339359 RepID=A0AAD5WRE0_9PEZI|nr:hypothetical protein MKZ38_004795 [Zalerion maritima]
MGPHYTSLPVTAARQAPQRLSAYLKQQPQVFNSLIAKVEQELQWLGTQPLSPQVEHNTRTLNAVKARMKQSLQDVDDLTAGQEARKAEWEQKQQEFNTAKAKAEQDLQARKIHMAKWEREARTHAVKLGPQALNAFEAHLAKLKAKIEKEDQEMLASEKSWTFSLNHKARRAELEESKQALERIQQEIDTAKAKAEQDPQEWKTRMAKSEQKARTHAVKRGPQALRTFEANLAKNEGKDLQAETEQEAQDMLAFIRQEQQALDALTARVEQNIRDLGEKGCIIRVVSTGGTEKGPSFSGGFAHYRASGFGLNISTANEFGNTFISGELGHLSSEFGHTFVSSESGRDTIISDLGQETTTSDFGRNTSTAYSYQFNDPNESFWSNYTASGFGQDNFSDFGRTLESVDNPNRTLESRNPGYAC